MLAHARRTCALRPGLTLIGDRGLAGGEFEDIVTCGFALQFIKVGASEAVQAEQFKLLGENPVTNAALTALRQSTPAMTPFITAEASMTPLPFTSAWSYIETGLLAAISHTADQIATSDSYSPSFVAKIIRKWATPDPPEQFRRCTLLGKIRLSVAPDLGSAFVMRGGPALGAEDFGRHSSVCVRRRFRTLLVRAISGAGKHAHDRRRTSATSVVQILADVLAPGTRQSPPPPLTCQPVAGGGRHRPAVSEQVMRPS